MIRKIWFAIVGGALAVQCPAASADPQPTATEIFYLRGECHRLGEAFGNTLVAGLSWSSPNIETNYNVKDNRCYMTISRYASEEGQRSGLKCNHLALYEVQTENLLAYVENGESCPTNYGHPNAPSKIGIIFDKSIPGIPFHGVEDTSEYVNAKMR